MLSLWPQQLSAFAIMLKALLYGQEVQLHSAGRSSTSAKYGTSLVSSGPILNRGKLTSSVSASCLQLFTHSGSETEHWRSFRRQLCVCEVGSRVMLVKVTTKKWPKRPRVHTRMSVLGLSRCITRGCETTRKELSATHTRRNVPESKNSELSRHLDRVDLVM